MRRLDQTGNVTFSSSANEKPLDATDEEVPYYESNPPFLAYATATQEGQPLRGELVYVNYGTVEDYTTLREHGINVTGMIAIAKFGRIFRGNILANAEQNGAIGLIIFSDPKDYTKGDGYVYPDSVYLPPTGAQRGTTMLGDGDPLTPFYPSIGNCFNLI